MQSGNRPGFQHGTRRAAHMRRIEQRANDQQARWTAKDAANYIWVLIPFALAGLQLFRLAGGNREVIYALTSSADTRALLLGVLVPQIPGLLIILMAMPGPGIVVRATNGMDADDRFLIGGAYIVIFACFLVFVDPLTATLASLALIGNFLSLAADDTEGRHHGNLLRFALILTVLYVAASPVMHPQWLPTEIIKSKNGGQAVGYVINPDQGGWATILVSKPKQIRRLKSEEIQERVPCTTNGQHSKSVRSALRRPIIRNFADYKASPACPKT